MNYSPDIPVEDRIYILRFCENTHMGVANRRYTYYTGHRPTKQLGRAKVFTLEKAKNTKQFSNTATYCEVKRVTHKIMFKAALQGI